MELNNFLLSIDEDGIAVFTANRPEKLNAMDATAWHELLTFFTQVNERPDVHAVIITGAGEKADEEERAGSLFPPPASFSRRIQSRPPNPRQFTSAALSPPGLQSLPYGPFKHTLP